MNFPFYIAKRYLFSKKSHNAVNIISIVAVCGVAVATMATVCSLSVLNGFRGLVTEMFGFFDPELKITPVKGKVFNPDTVMFQDVRSLPEIDLIAESLEDNVMINYRGRQGLAILKGVSDEFVSLANFGTILIDGDTVLKNEVNNFALLGLGIASHIGVNAGFVFPMEIDAPKRNVKVNLSNPIASINREYAYIGGVFQVNQSVYDENYVIAPIRLARDLFDYEKEVSALEIKLKAGASIKEVQAKIQKTVGADFYVKDRGEKSWTQVSQKLGNRCDVQCRYRYKQLQKEAAFDERKRAAAERVARAAPPLPPPEPRPRARPAQPLPPVWQPLVLPARTIDPAAFTFMRMAPAPQPMPQPQQKGHPIEGTFQGTAIAVPWVNIEGQISAQGSGVDFSAPFGVSPSGSFFGISPMGSFRFDS